MSTFDVQAVAARAGFSMLQADMAPIHCPECQREVPASVADCPHCGSQVRPRRERVTRLLLSAYNIGCLVILALLTAAFVYWLIRVLG